MREESILSNNYAQSCFVNVCKHEFLIVGFNLRKTKTLLTYKNTNYILNPETIFNFKKK